MRAISLRLFLIFAAAAFAITAFAQTCNTSTADDAPTSRYQANANGTVTDSQTGLMWMSCALGQTWNGGNSTCGGTAALYDWQAALQAVQSLDQGAGYAGYQDWRLPNLRELMSIARYHCDDPAINLTVFPGTTSQSFWSASPLEGSVREAWALNFSSGQAINDDMEDSFAIRLVRAGAFDNVLPPPGTAAPGAVINYQPQ